MALLEIDWTPTKRQLRTFGLVGFPMLTVLGAWLFFSNPQPLAGMSVNLAKAGGCLLWGLAALCGSLAIVRPGGLLPLYRLLLGISLPIGMVVSMAALAILYYLIVTPIGIVRRAMGRDALGLSLRAGSGSSWVPRKKVSDVRSYRRQF